MTTHVGEAGLVVESVSAHYQKIDFHYNFTVNRGECLGIVGPSGSGKSTLLSLIAGFNPVSEGDIRVNGRSIVHKKAFDRPVTEVFQANNLFAHLTLRQNVGLGIHPDLKLSSAQWQQVDHALKEVGLETLGARLPGTLSGGQQSRAALARALLRDRPVLLLDEPLAALGPAQRQTMLKLIRQLIETREMCGLLVSHQPDELMTTCDRIAFVSEGRIVWVGPPNELNAEEGPQVIREYLGNRESSSLG
ncbi:Thiamine import ATP-binding protein ThiQ [Halomonadaceae bacterium LMG 33818]|uniref:thiamine ABC transporter ATP-binding protein n=1 Tax=Cernens ardua TaxID=3402176 RepID=UPI003EDC5F0C